MKNIKNGNVLIVLDIIFFIWVIGLGIQSYYGITWSFLSWVGYICLFALGAAVFGYISLFFVAVSISNEPEEAHSFN